MMKTIDSLEEVQKIEFDILVYIDNYCKKNNLRYFLAGGTLLGAVRHKSFIPWDDDLDIAMPRPDYDKLLENFNSYAVAEELPYCIKFIRNDDNYCFPFAKIQDSRTVINERNRPKFNCSNMGIYVDIFPIDGFPSNESGSVKKLVSVQKKCFRMGLSFSSYINLNFYEKLKLTFYKIMFSFRNREKLIENEQDKLRKYDFDKSPYVVSTFGMKGEKEIIEQKYFSKAIKMKFVDREFMVPIGYDEYLTQMYGDYMKLPPEEQRISPHDIEAYWRD